MKLFFLYRSTSIPILLHIFLFLQHVHVRGLITKGSAQKKECKTVLKTKYFE